MIDNVTGRLMPRQMLPESEKTEEWRKSCMDALIGFGNQITANGRSTRQRKQANYDLMNSIYDERDFDYVTNPYNLPDKFGEAPTKMELFNIIRPKIEQLKGEEIQRPFKFMAVGVGGEVLNSRLEAKKMMISSYLEQKVVSELGEGEDPQKPLSQLIKEFDTSYQDIRERFANNILKYGEKKDKFQNKFNKGWEHALIGGEEIYYIGIVSNEPHIRVVNPIRFEFDRNMDVDGIEDGQWAREERFLSLSQILDEYGKKLKPEELKRLDEGIGNYGRPSSLVFDMRPGLPSTPNFSGNSPTNTFTDPNHIVVYYCVWKTLKKIGFLTYIDEAGEPQERIVEETFKLTPEQKLQGWSIEWEWINEVWGGTKIGQDIYVDIGPLPNQIRSIENPALCKLPYVGRVYNALNSRSTSLVDLVKPHQYTYMIVWWRLLQELAKAKGKKMIMDFAAIPRSQGIDVDKWMYYFDNLGIAWINSFEEGNESFNRETAVSKFNQYTAIDMSLSQSVQQYMMMIEKLENMVGELCGVSKQRTGQVSSSETVGGIERSIIQSSMVTEAYFYTHNEIKNQVLTQYIECAKIAYKNGKKAQFILNDIERVLLDIDGDILNDSDYAVFISNSNKDYQNLESIKGLAQVLLQKDSVQLSDIINIYKAQSVSEAEREVIASEKAYNERQQAVQESQQQAMLQQQEMINADRQAERDFIAGENEKDRQARLEEATIKAVGFSQDVNANAVPDVLEMEKLRAKNIETQVKERMKDKEILANQINDDKRMQHESQMQDKELEMKNKEIASKEKIAKSKPKPKANKK